VLRVSQKLTFTLCLVLAASGAGWAKTPQKKAHPAAKKTSAKSAKHSRHGRAKKASWRHRGQQGIDSTRCREIQEALIKANYLGGGADGNFDARTKAALVKYQADNGWQTKVVPDSRALIKLGLGPSHENLLNPDTAALTPVFAGSETMDKTGSQR
jgi:peptidoglycan hydrolase-like protein with peptidoglycan-binding domain